MNVEPSPPRPLRVLSVEDEPVFADVLRRLLEREGFAVTIERVASKPDLERALDDGAWDIVLSDHSVPGLSSTDALREVQTRGLDLPFIVVSGHIGEEATVEAMREGAHDYVSKASLNRLGVAVRRTLKDAAERATLRQRERDLEALHDVAFAAGRALDPARLAAFAVERARELLHADGAWLYWWDAAAGVLRRIASTHRRDEDVALELRPGQSVSGAAFERGELVAVARDASSSDRVPEIDAGVVSAIAAPLFVGERIVGTLSAGSDSFRHFTPQEVRVLALLGAEVAPALEASRLLVEAQRAANYDAITGLPNRASFVRRLGEQMREATSRGATFAVLYADIDRFREINDAFGHEGGDDVLREFGARVARTGQEALDRAPAWASTTSRS